MLDVSIIFLFFFKDINIILEVIYKNTIYLNTIIKALIEIHKFHFSLINVYIHA